MATNIEIKAAARDWERQRAAAERLAGGPATLIVQADTFFRVAQGRLKLREFGPGRGELIAYERPERLGPKASTYVIAPTAEPARLRACLAAALGVLGEVRKRRWLYLVGQTRVHFDEVEGLGRFIELEVVMRDGQRAEEGEAVARGLMRELGIEEGELLERAYVEMLLGDG